MLPIISPLNDTSLLANLSQNDIEPILLQLTKPELCNCSLLSKQFYNTMNIFWQRKSYIDFFPAFKPVAPFMPWYALQDNRRKDKERTSLGLPTRVTYIDTGWHDNLSNRIFCSFFFMRTPEQLLALIEKERVSPILLVGNDAVLAQAAAAFRSAELEERKVIGQTLLDALPMPIQNQVYSAFYESLPDAYKSEYRPKIELGKDAFYSDLIPIDSNLRHQAIESCLMDRLSALP